MGYRVLAEEIDEDGICMEAIRKENPDMVYVMPSHQFPLGNVMPLRRRLELLQWASEGEERYIIEDDHDSEFRYKGKPIPALWGNDTGEHGYMEGRVVNGRIRTEFVPFACRSYQQLVMPLHEETTQISLEEAVKSQIFRRGGRNIYRIILQGMRSPDLLLIPEKLKSLGNITDVVDESWPAYDLEELYKRYSGTLIGDYIGYFLAKGRMDTVEKKALYYGLQALLETGSRR